MLDIIMSLFCALGVSVFVGAAIFVIFTSVKVTKEKSKQMQDQFATWNASNKEYVDSEIIKAKKEVVNRMEEILAADKKIFEGFYGEDLRSFKRSIDMLDKMVANYCVVVNDKPKRRKK